MDASTIKGLAVVSMSEGTNLGRVDDVLIGPQGLRIVGLRVSGPDQTFAIPFDKIAHIGADAVTVQSSQAWGWTKNAVQTEMAITIVPAPASGRRPRTISSTPTASNARTVPQIATPRNAIPPSGCASPIAMAISTAVTASPPPTVLRSTRTAFIIATPPGSEPNPLRIEPTGVRYAPRVPTITNTGRVLVVLMTIVT